MLSRTAGTFVWYPTHYSDNGSTRFCVELSFIILSSQGSIHILITPWQIFPGWPRVRTFAVKNIEQWESVFLNWIASPSYDVKVLSLWRHSTGNVHINTRWKILFPVLWNPLFGWSVSPGNLFVIRQGSTSIWKKLEYIPWLDKMTLYNYVEQ